MENLSRIIIQSSETGPRLDYVIRHVQSQLGLEFRKAGIGVEETGIHYGKTPVNGMLNIYSTGLLSENSVSPISPEPANFDKISVLFPAPKGYDLPFDIFAAIFYMLSRYEEYLPFEADAYGRFEASESLAYRGNFLMEPVVDQWLHILKTLIKKKFPKTVFKEAAFSFQSTIDIDNPWAFRHRGVIRNTGGLFKDLLAFNGKILQRLSAITYLGNDPFDVYSWIREKEDEWAFNSIYFFLSGDYGNFDVNYPLKTIAFSKLIRKLSDDRQIGIHPSFRSNESFDRLKKEYDLFSEILGKKPTISRQHFLMLRMPETYNRLIRLGIRDDYSMGFASMPGFRAGTSRPFKFYDLNSESETELTVHPFVVMDITLQQYLKLSVPLAIEKIAELTGTLKSVNGLMTLLWHNESLCDLREWKEWRKVFISALMYADNP